MRLTESKLRQIIREEIALSEAFPPPPPRTDSSKPAQKGAPPPPPKGTTVERKGLPIPPKAATTLKDFMNEVIKMTEKLKTAAKNPESKEAKEMLATFHKGDWDKTPIDSYEMWDKFKSEFGRGYYDKHGEAAADKVLDTLGACLSVDKNTGKYTGKTEQQGAVSYELYIQDNKVPLEKVVEIISPIPARIRLAFQKAGIQQP